MSDAALAQTGSATPRKELQEARKKELEARREAREARREAREAGAEVLEAGKERREARREAARAWRDKVRARLAEMKTSREQRRNTRREALRKRWGKALEAPPATQEMRRHAWRVARLTQARVVAEELGNADAVARIDRLMAMEKERHEKRMTAAAAEPMAASSPAPAQPSGVPVAAPAGSAP
jgi:hypothetical protein